MRARALVAAGVLAVVVAVPSVVLVGPSANAGRISEWKGAETFTQTSLAPNPSRCGVAPPNFEASFAGNGIDTVGGAFAVTVSGCMNIETMRVSDAEATDVYLTTGDSVRILPDDFTLTLDPDTCIATNATPAPFRVGGGTGAFDGARGSGHFDMALNWTPCNGQVGQTHVWFRGSIEP